VIINKKKSKWTRGGPMTIDRKFNQFRLIKQPKKLSEGQAEFLYKLIIELGGDPEKSKTDWLPFTGVVNKAEAAGYEEKLDPERGDVDVPSSVYHWLNKWSREGYMLRE
jgi:hypothetical protein